MSNNINADNYYIKFYPNKLYGNSISTNAIDWHKQTDKRKHLLDVLNLLVESIRMSLSYSEAKNRTIYAEAIPNDKNNIITFNGKAYPLKLEIDMLSKLNPRKFLVILKPYKEWGINEEVIKTYRWFLL